MSALGCAARALAGIVIGKVTLTTADAPSEPAAPPPGPLRLQTDFARHVGLREDVPLLQHFGFTSRPPIGTDVLAVFPDGDSTNAVVIASGDKATRLQGLSKGDAALYDARGAYVWLTPEGVHIQAVGMPVKVEGATTVEVVATEAITLRAPQIKLNPPS